MKTCSYLAGYVALAWMCPAAFAEETEVASAAQQRASPRSWSTRADVDVTLVGKGKAFSPPHDGNEAKAPVPWCRKSPEVHTLQIPKQNIFGSDWREELFVFGGKGWTWIMRPKNNINKKSDADPELRETATMLGDSWTAALSDFPKRAAWHSVTQVVGPPARWKAGVTTINDDTQLAVFGGCTSTEIEGVLNDLWVFTPTSSTEGTWREVRSMNTPSVRRGHVFAANTSHLVVYGGKTLAASTNGNKAHGGLCVTDISFLPLSALAEDADESERVWTKGTSYPGDCRWGATGDVVRDKDDKEVLILFGGRFLHANGSYTYYNEIILYDFEKDAWSVVEPRDGIAPERRDHHATAEIDGNFWVFAGRTKFTRDADAVLNDVWSYSVKDNQWTVHSIAKRSGTPGYPAPRYMPGATGITWNGEKALAIFGGEYFPGSTTESTMNDVWVFTDTKGWTMLRQSSCPSKKDTGEPYELEELSNVQPWRQLAAAVALLALVSAFAAKGLALRRRGRREADEEQLYLRIAD